MIWEMLLALMTAAGSYTNKQKADIMNEFIKTYNVSDTPLYSN